MKIVHLNTHDWYGGASVVANRLAQCQRKLGFDSRILCGYKIKDDPYSSVFPIEKVDDDHKIKEGWVYSNLKGSAKLPDHPLVSKADLLHVHNLHGGYFNYEHLSLLAKHIPLVWTLHDMHGITGRCAHSMNCSRWESGCGKCPHLEYYPQASSNSDASAEMWHQKRKIYEKIPLNLVCPSQWLMSKVSRSMLADNNVSLIYNGVDERKFHPKSEITSRIHGLEPSSLLVGFLAHGGIKNPYKGGEFLLEAVHTLRERFPNAYFIEIGGNPEDDELPERFIKANYTKDEDIIVNLYNSLDLLLYPSLADNCPLVVLEAMACGTPVVAFPTGGIPELIKNRHSGLITNEINSASLIKASSMLMESEKMRTQMSYKSRQAVIESFTINKQNNSYWSLYERAIQNHKKATFANG